MWNGYGVCSNLASSGEPPASHDHFNSAARVVTGTRKYDHITPVLRDLHWLPVRHRIDFKMAMTVFKCIHGLVPHYLADKCVLASTVHSRRHLRSADTMKLVVQRTKTVIGTRAFAVRRCCYCMEQTRLPADIRTSTCTVQTFAQKLKTFYASRRI